MQELSDLLDDIDAGSLRHLELSNQKVNRFLAFVLVRYYKIDSSKAADEELDLALEAEFYQQQLGGFKVHKLIVKHHDSHPAGAYHSRHRALVLAHCVNIAIQIQDRLLRQLMY